MISVPLSVASTAVEVAEAAAPVLPAGGKSARQEVAVPQNLRVDLAGVDDGVHRDGAVRAGVGRARRIAPPCADSRHVHHRGELTPARVGGAGRIVGEASGVEPGPQPGERLGEEIGEPVEVQLVEARLRVTQHLIDVAGVQVSGRHLVRHDQRRRLGRHRRGWQGDVPRPAAERQRRQRHRGAAGDEVPAR